MTDLVYYVASTLDGYIAEPDGSFDKFLWNDEVVNDFFASYAWFDRVLMGRKTYDVAYKQGINNPYPDLKTFVVSRTLEASPDPNVTVVREGVIDFVRSLKAETGKPIWLCGGGNLAAQLFNEQLIDKLVIKLNPLILGDGIPLFTGAVKSADLVLTSSKSYTCGILLRHYTVNYHQQNTSKKK